MTRAIPLNADPQRPDQRNVGDWLSAHIFYASDRGIVLGDCIAPLIRELRTEGLISQHFFVRHWLEGQHVRLRVRPASCAVVPELTKVVDTAISDFLARSPSATPDRDLTDAQYYQRFCLEFSTQQWTERYGAATRMPRRANNSWEYMEYVPEYQRYGGTSGVELAEWHAMSSSELVLALYEQGAVRQRDIMLGCLTRLIITMVDTVIGPDDAAEFLTGHLKYWEWMFEPRYDHYEQRYLQMANALVKQVTELRASLAREPGPALPGFVEMWLTHCIDLRQRLGTLIVGDDPSADPVDAPAPALLSSYIHMLCNRFGAALDTEMYLTYVLWRAIRT